MVFFFSIETAVELRKNISAKQTYPPSHYGPFSSAAKTKGTANAVVLGTNGDLVSVVRYVLIVSLCHSYPTFLEPLNSEIEMDFIKFKPNQNIFLWNLLF